MATDPTNRSLAGIDPFGFRRGMVPPLNPDEYLGSGAPDAASHWLERGREAANEATNAVTVAIQSLVEQQADDVLVGIARDVRGRRRRTPRERRDGVMTTRRFVDETRGGKVDAADGFDQRGSARETRPGIGREEILERRALGRERIRFVLEAADRDTHEVRRG